MDNFKSTFPDTLKLVDVGMRNGSRIFQLEKNFRVKTSKGEIVIPRNFCTDGASVPRIFWTIFDPFGPYFYAALLHDFLYSQASDKKYKFSRSECDLLFKEAMFNSGVNWLTRGTIYRAVRLGGGYSFKKK